MRRSCVYQRLTAWSLKLRPIQRMTPMSFLDSGERICQGLLSRDGFQGLASRTELTFLITTVSPVQCPSSNGDEQLSTLTRTALFDETARPTELLVSICCTSVCGNSQALYHQHRHPRVARRAHDHVCRRNERSDSRSSRSKFIDPSTLLKGNSRVWESWCTCN